jgi:D-alanyl-D-alanine carboxypeptidase
VAGLSEAFELIGAALEHHLPATHAAGAALAITDRDAILGVVVRGFADVGAGTPVRPETRFQIGSISKSFSAAILMQEVEAGRLDLHVSINEILPWLELPEPFGPITLHHLMTHSSGLLIGTEDSPTVWGVVANLRRCPPTFAPGEYFFYSNDGYKLVGLALEAVSGLPIHELVRDRMLQPLGMVSSAAAITDEVRAHLSTGYEPMFSERPPQLTHPLVPSAWIRSNTADGSIVSNVVDMAAYARFLLSGGEGPNGRVLSESAFASLVARRIEDTEDDDYDYAYGLDVEKPGAPERYIGHGGGMVGYTAQLSVLPDAGLGCVMLQNGSGNKGPLVRYALEVVRACLAGEPMPDPVVPRDPEVVPNPGDFAGSYEGDRRTIEIEVIDGERLRLIAGSVRVVLQQDALSSPGDVFLVPHPSLERHVLRFGRDAERRVVEAFHGDEWFRGERFSGPEPVAHPPEWDAFTGLYRSNDPWGPAIRVVLRKETLAVQWPWESTDGPDEDLTPLENGWFAVGEPWTPRRVRFLDVIDGKAAIVEYTGARWYRSFEE